MKSLVIIALAATPAYADEEPRVWLLDLTATAEIGMYADLDTGEPLSIAPDISLLAIDVPQFEIVHSSHAITGFHGALLGTSFCVRGDTCDGVYHDAGFQVTKAVRTHRNSSGELNPTALSITGGAVAYDFDPFMMSAKLGMRGSYVTSSLLQFQIVPAVHIALNKRDAQPDRVFVPVTATVVASAAVSIQFETGIASTLDEFSDHLAIPVGANLDISSGETSVVASITFPAAYGGDAVAVTGMDACVITLGLRWSKFLGGETE